MISIKTQIDGQEPFVMFADDRSFRNVYTKELQVKLHYSVCANADCPKSVQPEITIRFRELEPIPYKKEVTECCCSEFKKQLEAALNS